MLVPYLWQQTIRKVIELNMLTYVVREFIEDGVVKIKFIRSKEMI